MSAEQIGLWAGFILTLMVLSYLLADNVLYRLAVSVFVGLAAGYVTVVTTESVLLPWLNSTIFSGQPGGVAIGMIPVLLGVLLLLKTSPRLGRLGNLALAFVVAVGAAVAIVGAVGGTLIPLVGSTTQWGGDLVSGIIVVIGVICSLMYFHTIGSRRPDGTVRSVLLVRLLAGVGKGFIVVTLGALYGAAILSSLMIFSERIGFVLALIAGG